MAGLREDDLARLQAAAPPPTPAARGARLRDLAYDDLADEEWLEIIRAQKAKAKRGNPESARFVVNLFAPNNLPAGPPAPAGPAAVGVYVSNAVAPPEPRRAVAADAPAALGDGTAVYRRLFGMFLALNGETAEVVTLAEIAGIPVDAAEAAVEGDEAFDRRPGDRVVTLTPRGRAMYAGG